MTRIVPSGSRRRRRRHVPGTPPGTLVAAPEAPPTRIRLISYGPAHLEERDLAPGEDVTKIRADGRVVWINVDGLGDLGLLSALGHAFGMHRLALEDVVNLGQRTKVEFYDENIFLVMHMPRSIADPGGTEQVSLFLGPGFVISFQESTGDCFEPVRERLRHGRGRIRQMGADYLAYALLDAVLDGWFPVLESLYERLEAIEPRIFHSPDRETMEALQRIKETLRDARRVTTPFREAINTLLRQDAPGIHEETRVHLRDCADHAARITELVDSSREFASDLMGTYVAALNHRLGEVMKLLTIMAAIFIPLTLVAGIYGMNFAHMPELQWKYGYPAVMILMGGIAGGLVIYFRRRGWLG